MMSEHRLEVADVFRTHGDDFLARWGRVLFRAQRKAFDDIRACRTAALGGHLDQCDQCGHCAISYNSCRNRSCPKCQGAARVQWLADREAELLPVEYFHVVFTLPQQIARLALQNGRRIYSILFRAAAETLLTIAADPQHLGAAIGFLAVLHSWGQNLHLHPHIHCVVPGGGISLDNSRWIPCRRYRKSFFLPGKVLSRFFRKRFPGSFAKVVPEGQTPVPWRTGIVGPPGCLRGIVSEGRPHGMGGIRQASLRRATTGSQVSGPIHASRCHFQPAPVIDGGWSSHIRVEGLCRRQSDQDDDLGGGRIHSSFSPSRAALRLCSHPSFWLSGQPQTKGKTGAVPVLAGRHASCQRPRRRFPDRPRFRLLRTAPPMPSLQGRSADSHTSPHRRGLRLLTGAPHRRHLMTTVSIPPTKSLISSFALLRATGDPCRKPSFWHSKNVSDVCRPRNRHPPKWRATVSTADSSRRQSLFQTPVNQTVIQYP